MFYFLRKKNTKPSFEINNPKLSITPGTRNFMELLKNTGVEYKAVTNGYIVFKGCVFDSEMPLMIGVHFNKIKIKFIEIYRTREYYESENYDVDVSFAELSYVLKKKYGRPTITLPASLYGYPHEKWYTRSFTINHYIMDRFGPEEHLEIKFCKK